MATTVNTKVTKATILLASPDAYAWADPYGGSWSTASNWSDTTAGTIATVAPGAANSVVITGGSNGNFTNIIGTGAAAQLSIGNDVLLWGAVTVMGTVALGTSADLDFDGGASLAAAGLSLANGASLDVGGSSTLSVVGGATLTSSFLAAIDGSAVKLGGLIANTGNQGYPTAVSTVAVDDDSSIEIGTTGGAALGAITIDSGVTTAVSGTMDGNIVVNGVLGVQAYGNLRIDIADPFGTAQSIGGTGTLALTENSLLTLGVADSAAITFGGPAGTLALDVLPTGTINGFTAGDVIEVVSGGTSIATGLRYVQTSATLATLTLVKAGRPVGTLTLAGNFAAGLFHLSLDTAGDGFITLQTIGSPPVQPSLIVGTVGYDVLRATANNQTLTGLGGNDALSAAGFGGIDFQDTGADLNGSSITSFGTSDVIDLTDMNPSTVSASFVSGTGATGTLTVTDGTHTATISLSFASGLPVGFFTTATDGAGGSDVRFTAPNTDIFVFGTAQSGAYGTAAKWQDTTTGTVAAMAPSYGNAVTITGGTGYTDVTGNGFAASLTTAGDVLLWGTVIVGSKLAGVSGALTQTGTLALDGRANLVLDGNASLGGLTEIGDGSTLTAAAVTFSTSGASLLAIGGSSVRFPTVLGSSGSPGGSQYAASVIGVDANSSIEFGSTGTAVAGAISIDSGMTVDLAGAIDGNVVVNGTLIAAGILDVAPFGSVAPLVSGPGTLELTFGNTLGLAGADTTAILFSQTGSGSYASTSETLALGSIMPTATISGFSKGDVITVALVVTNLLWNGVKLTLLNGGTTVGTLLLSGTYASNQFQVQPSGNGLSSAITYAATPGTAGGNSVSGTSDSYAWNTVSGGVWNNASEWTDTTTGATPTAAPGAGNAITINDNTGSWTPQIIYGPGAAASLTISAAADTILIGSFAIGGQFAVNNVASTPGDTALYGGSNLSVGSLSVTSLFRVASASLMTVLGSANGTFISGEMMVGSDSIVRVQGGTSVITGTVAVDGTSNVEFGTAGTAVAGTLTIDSGQAPTLQGVATIEANVVVNGSLLVYSGTIEGFAGAAGSIGGTGTITIGALGSYGYLVLDASDTDPIVFQGYSLNNVPYAFESLELKGPLRTGTITGFIVGDSIIIDQNVTGASFVQTTATLGTLTLTNGAAIVGTLTFAGSYAGKLFQIDLSAQTGVATVSVQAATTASGTAAASTNGDAYSWTGASGGSWALAADWQDTTAAITPTTVPGSANAVTIAGNFGVGQYTTIGGNGTTAGMMITGNVLLTGRVNVAGTVHISSGNGPAAALTLEAGAALTAGGSVEAFGRFEVGGGSTSTITGYALLFSGALLALGGSTVQAGGLIGDGSGDVLAVDANSAVRIGTATATATGALTIATGAPVQFTGLIYGSVVDNGDFWVGGGGTLLIDMTATAEVDPYETSPTISGSGLLLLTEGSTLGLGVTDSATIQFAGPNATLLLAAIPTATIIGFVSGDQIDVDQTVTGLTYTQVSSTLATVTLTNGASTVGVLKFNGAFTGSGYGFHLDSAPNGATAVITLQSLQIAQAQPTLISGTVGSDFLVATANGQTITGNGGSDILSGGTFTGIDFRDYSFYLSGSEVENFAPSDKLDFIDVSAATATASYTGGVLSVTDGTHAASLALSFATYPTSGSFHTASDGASGTILTWS